MSICLCAAVALALSACDASPRKQRYSAAYTDVFDTVTEFTAYCDSKESFEKTSELVHGELVRLHRLFDIYNEYEGVTNLASVNRLAPGASVSAGHEIAEVLSVGKDFYRLSGGKLNIALGSVLSIWHSYREKGAEVPPEPLLRAASAHASIDSVTIGESGEISFSDSETKLDVGAVAKGYACARAAGIAKTAGVNDFALNLGGNVFTSGEKPNGPWVIGVQDPEGGILTAVRVSGLAVVTSGDYQRYYEVGGVRYHHIIDPDTLYPAALYRSVTVICADPTKADALSTSLFCMPLESGKELARSLGAQALWVLADGSLVRTEGFGDYE